MLLGHRVPLPEQFYVFFAKSEKLHASLGILWKEYSVPLSEEQTRLIFR
jgi:hypothetical protein